MGTDCRGLAVTASDRAAVEHYDRTIAAYLGLRQDTGEHLKRTFEADPEMPLAHATRGCFFKLFCTAPLERKAVEAWERADALAQTRRANGRERAHIAALGAWCRGDIAGATQIWEGILLDHPRDVLALRLAHFTHFYMGDSTAMRDSIARVLPYWDESAPGYGFVLGFRAFGLEETGDYGAAEAVGKDAVSRNPEDIWATHAVAHVMEMQGRHADGIDWLERLSGNWGACNNFAYHVWWHLCLFHLERAEWERVLALYDGRVRADLSADYLDMSNAIALLWRLEDVGVDVGARWTELADKSAAKSTDGIFVFHDLHYLLALARCGRFAEAGALIEAMEAAARADTTEAPVYDAVGLPAARGIVALAKGEAQAALAHLVPVRRQIWRIGGSHAQRDLFFRIVVRAALSAGAHRLARALLAESTALNANSSWLWGRTAEALEGMGDPAGAADARDRAMAAVAA